jgi:hypothetical protein
VPRIEAEVLADPDDGTGATRLTRQGVEVLYTPPPTVLLPRFEAEVLADPDDGTGATRLTRQGVEVVYSPPPFVGLFRMEADALVDPDDGTGAVRLTRQGIEVLYPRPPAGPTPLNLPANYEVFIHSWESGLSLRNAYLTDVTSSPITGAEERRSLRDKPRRTMSAVYMNTTREIIDRLIVNAKKLTNTQVPFPLYCDESVGTADSALGQTSVWCDTTLRRFFTGGRVLIVPHLPGNFVSMDLLATGIIEEIHDDHLVLEDVLPLSFTEGQFSVYPLIDCEIVLRPAVTFQTHHTVTWTLEVSELLGANTLPATRYGAPLDLATLEGLPILNYNQEQNFESGVEISYARDGSEFGRGRSNVVDPNDYRYKQLTQWKFLMTNREDAWRVIQFLDWARGRGRAFWVMDEEDLWTPIALDPTFIEIDRLGEFYDFATDLDYIGIEMNDGTIHARRVNTIQDLTTVWRVTTSGDDLPSLDLADIRRIARMRKSRLVDDEFEEDWQTLEVCKFRFKITETLDEGEETT